MTSSPLGGRGRRVAAGLAVSGVGFLLTRYPVLSSLRTDGGPVDFLVGGAPALVAGLALTAYGVGLAASDRPATEAVTVARWCLLGVAVMATVVVATYVSGGRPMVEMTGARLVANVLLAGAVGGAVTGEHAAASHRNRDALATRSDRLTVLNRILRHEVLNSLNVISGYAGMTDGGDGRAGEVIRRRAARIDAVVDDVSVITDTDGPRPVRVDEHVRRAVGAAREDHPGARVEVGDLPAVDVRGNAHLHLAFEHLVDNAVAHDGDDRPRVRVTATADERTVRVRVRDRGPGVPASQRELLEGGPLPEYDDPEGGFGLPFVRLLLDGVGGRARVETPPGGGTAVTVELRRADAGGTRVGVPPERLGRGAAAALVAGVAMGGLVQTTTGGIAVIGALYAGMNVSVGWLTHLFHSVVFGIGFVVALDRTRLGRYCRGVAACAAVGVGYGVLLWLVAAGLVMPLWLRAVGVLAPVPNLGLGSLAGHVAWGAVLGGLVGALD
ncbi:MAG: ATP-binding protein [Haloferacaceae archaeon]